MLVVVLRRCLGETDIEGRGGETAYDLGRENHGRAIGQWLEEEKEEEDSM